MDEHRPRLVLIDGHAVAYRQYFATVESLHSGRAFRTSAGEPTNAVHGFANVLLDILKGSEPPDYIAVVFDQGLSGRDTTFVEYKTNRKEMDSDLDIQIPRIRQLVTAFNIPILEKEGYEADDVIGSLARIGVPMGVDVHILTGDSDLIQLVNEHVTIKQLIPRGDPKFWDAAAVMARYGLRPDQFVDYKALTGDSSDNYPGVAGIGDKTATKLLQQYGTLESIYAHLDDQKGSQREKLERGRDDAFVSQKLAAIITDLPVELDLQKCITHDYDPARVDELFKVLEFNAIRKRLGLTPPEPQSIVPKPAAPTQMSMFSEETLTEAVDEAPVAIVNTVVVDSEDKLAALVAALTTAQGIAFDTETTGIDNINAALVGISLAVDGDTGYYLPVGHNTGEPQLPLERVIDALSPALTARTIPKYAHNAVYDLIMLRRYGIDVSPIGFDTMIGEFLNNPSGWGKGLKDSARQRLGVRMTHIEELIGRGKKQITMDQVSIASVAPYAAADAVMTYRLVEPIRADLRKNNLMALYEELENPLIPVIADLDMTGVRLDLPYLAELSKEFEARLRDKADQIIAAAGEPLNIGSPKQLNYILFEKLKLPTRGLSKSTHGFSVDAAALEELLPHHPIIGLIMDWRSLEKLRSTYIDAMPKLVDANQRIHTSYNQTGAVTGRLSSENPNLQNIPIRTEEGRRVRRAFIAPDGYLLLSVDYSQIELRILAHYSGDPFLIDAFAHNQDIHRATAAAVAGVPFDQVTKEQRYFAKRVNFGLLYGMGAARLVRESELSPAEARVFIDQYFTRLSGVKAYLDNTRQRAINEGYLTTLRGRRRDFSMLSHPSVSQRDKARMEREAVNMPIQGSAADIIKQAMIDLSARLKAEYPLTRMILQVHDELVLEVPEADIPVVGALTVSVMEAVGPKFGIQVPIRADANVGKNWAEMQPLAEWIAAV